MHGRFCRGGLRFTTCEPRDASCATDCGAGYALVDAETSVTAGAVAATRAGGAGIAISCMPHELPFASLSEDAAAAVRERQLHLQRKQAKLERKQQLRVARASSIMHLHSAGDESTSGSYRNWISKAQYF